MGRRGGRAVFTGLRPLVAFRAFAVVAADLPVWFSAVADRENNVDRM